VYSFIFVTPSAADGAAAAAGEALLGELRALGCRLLGSCDIPQLVHQAAALAPELVICAMPSVDEPLLAALAELQASAPLPVLVITEDNRADTLQRALDAGVHGWAAGWQWQAEGEARAAQSIRLAAELRLTHLRFTREAAARAALADALARLDERKWVERAKGVLMAARQIGEDDAFRLLRGASMHTNLRVGEVSRSVIEAAQLADAVNRAGQLRMLSQRIVRLLAQCAAGVELRRSREMLDESQQRVRDNLERLQALPLLTTGSATPTGALAAAPAVAPAPALAEVAAAWAGLQPLLVGTPKPAGLRAADAQAERLLECAERLTAAIESSGGRQGVHIVNVSGRQRMLVQRLAKDALLDALLDDPAARERVSLATLEFGQALGLLDRAPLSSAEIREALASARAEWLRLLQALRDARSKSGRQALARGSETLLALFERLTEMYERSLQVIMGG
jgi:AmiR/NasT family two-component response regulator